jgi:hypothetical protein
MPESPGAQNPVVLSYLALRRAVGVIALALPFALSIPWWLVCHHLQGSISGYYYTGMRNLFVGSLCAISMFMFCCRGYDRKDEVAGIFSSFCALGVAFFPTTPDHCASKRQCEVGTIHYIFAALLFLTLAVFCLYLFKMTAPNETPTRKKGQRNMVYTICGSVILVSVLAIAVCAFTHVKRRGIWPVAVFETTSLLAFGFAWLIKGETFLKDENGEQRKTLTTDKLLKLSTK